jgi:hypothetical protein
MLGLTCGYLINREDACKAFTIAWPAGQPYTAPKIEELSCVVEKKLNRSGRYVVPQARLYCPTPDKPSMFSADIVLLTRIIRVPVQELSDMPAEERKALAVLLREGDLDRQLKDRWLKEMGVHIEPEKLIFKVRKEKYSGIWVREAGV